MKTKLIVSLSLLLFHLTVSAVMSVIAHTSFMSDYHNGQGLWNFAFDSIGYHEMAMRATRLLENGEFDLWWDKSFFRHAKLISLLYHLFHPHPFSFAILNSLTWVASVACVYLIATHIFTKSKKFAMVSALLVGLWPSNLLLGTQLLRDPFFNLGILLMLLGWVALLNENRGVVYSLLASFGMIFSVWIRPEPFWLLLLVSILAAGLIALYTRRVFHYALLSILMTGLFYSAPSLAAYAEGARLTSKATQASAEVDENSAKIAIVKTKIKMIIGDGYNNATDRLISEWFISPRFSFWSFNTKKMKLMALAVVHGRELNGFLVDWNSEWRPTLWAPAKLDGLVQRASAYRDGFLVWYLAPGASLLDSDILFRGIPDVITYFPRALMIGFFAPFPNQWFTVGRTGGRAIRFMGGFETMVLYFLMAGFLIFLAKAPIVFRVKLWLVLFMVIMILPLGLFVPNLGTLFRMRFIYLTPILAGGLWGIGTIIKSTADRKSRRR